MTSSVSPPSDQTRKRRRLWYALGAGGLLVLLLVLILEGLARTVWTGIGGLLWLIWSVARVLWRLIAPG